MDYNAFVGGISPGGLTNDFEVKILICCLLDKIGEGLTFEQMNEALQRTGYVNYFEFTEAVSELKSSEHLKEVQDNKMGEVLLVITELGRATANTFAKTIPRTVRDKTIKIAEEILRITKRKEEITVTYKKVHDGYTLSVSMKDVGTDLLGADLFVPTEKQCELIKSRIYANPADIYRGLLALFTGNYKTLMEIAEQEIDKQGI